MIHIFFRISSPDQLTALFYLGFLLEARSRHPSTLKMAFLNLQRVSSLQPSCVYYKGSCLLCLHCWSFLADLSHVQWGSPRKAGEKSGNQIYLRVCHLLVFAFLVSITYNIDWMKCFIPTLSSNQHLIPLQFSIKHSCKQTGIRTIL